MELPKTIKQLIESLRIEVSPDHVTVYDLEEHLYRLVSSIDQLGFDIPPQINEYQEFVLFFQNQIKNKAQYYFKKPVSFLDSQLSVDSSKLTVNRRATNQPLTINYQLFKLRIIYSHNAKFSIDIEPYTRDLSKAWQVKNLDPKEFHIKTTDYQWKHKFYPRPATQSLSHSATSYDEVIWCNEHGRICEGSFTNIFFYNSQGQLCTPSLDCNILAGIMRSKIMETFEVIQGHYYPRDLENGFFLVNSMLIKSVDYTEQS